MGRQRRRFISKTPYEICFRAREGLPFAAYKTIELLIKSALARTQRDDKVTLCHDIWEGSHFHGLVIFYDAEDGKRFYEELEKKLTDSLKRLLGLDYLNLWEKRPMVAPIEDEETAIERISYFYANPAQDNLVDFIEKFPGYSSFPDFIKCKDSLSSFTSEEVPWIRLPSIPRLRSRVLTMTQDLGIRALLTKRNKKKHTLKRLPNEWMRCFEVYSDDDVAQINNQIMDRLREREAEARENRLRKGIRLKGVSKLCSTPILAPHTPKKKERRIFVLASTKEARIAFIEMIKTFNEECRRCFDEWRRGNFLVGWPPGAFRPPIPPAFNALPGY